MRKIFIVIATVAVVAGMLAMTAAPGSGAPVRKTPVREAPMREAPVGGRQEEVEFVKVPPPVQFSSVAKNRERVRKVNEARRESIAALFRRYNKKLTDKQAYDYAVLVIQTSDNFSLDPFVIAAMVVNESSARPDAVSRGGDYGLMQVRWRVHQKKIKQKHPHIRKASDMLDPGNNLRVGTEIFATYYATAGMDVRKALMYYTAGNAKMADKVFAVQAQLEKSYHERLRKN
jgi:soluble lytic murein transglycosylase-like protein